MRQSTRALIFVLLLVLLIVVALVCSRVIDCRCLTQAAVQAAVYGGAPAVTIPEDPISEELGKIREALGSPPIDCIAIEERLNRVKIKLFLKNDNQDEVANLRLLRLNKLYQILCEIQTEHALQLPVIAQAAATLADKLPDKQPDKQPDKLPDKQPDEQADEHANLFADEFASEPIAGPYAGILAKLEEIEDALDSPEFDCAAVALPLKVVGDEIDDLLLNGTRVYNDKLEQLRARHLELCEIVRLEKELAAQHVDCGSIQERLRAVKESPPQDVTTALRTTLLQQRYQIRCELELPEDEAAFAKAEPVVSLAPNESKDSIVHLDPDEHFDLGAHPELAERLDSTERALKTDEVDIDNTLTKIEGILATQPIDCYAASRFLEPNGGTIQKQLDSIELALFATDRADIDQLEKLRSRFNLAQKQFRGLCLSHSNVFVPKAAVSPSKKPARVIPNSAPARVNMQPAASNRWTSWSRLNKNQAEENTDSNSLSRQELMAAKSEADSSYNQFNEDFQRMQKMVDTVAPALMNVSGLQSLIKILKREPGRILVSKQYLESYKHLLESVDDKTLAGYNFCMQAINANKLNSVEDITALEQFIASTNVEDIRWKVWFDEKIADAKTRLEISSVSRPAVAVNTLAVKASFDNVVPEVVPEVDAKEDEPQALVPAPPQVVPDNVDELINSFIAQLKKRMYPVSEYDQLQAYWETHAIEETDLRRLDIPELSEDIIDYLLTNNPEQIGTRVELAFNEFFQYECDYLEEFLEHVWSFIIKQDARDKFAAFLVAKRKLYNCLQEKGLTYQHLLPLSSSATKQLSLSNPNKIQSEEKPVINSLSRQGSMSLPIGSKKPRTDKILEAQQRWSAVAANAQQSSLTGFTRVPPLTLNVNPMAAKFLEDRKRLGEVAARLNAALVPSLLKTAEANEQFPKASGFDTVPPVALPAAAVSALPAAAASNTPSLTMAATVAAEEVPSREHQFREHQFRELLQGVVERPTEITKDQTNHVKILWGEMSVEFRYTNWRLLDAYLLISFVSTFKRKLQEMIDGNVATVENINAQHVSFNEACKQRQYQGIADNVVSWVNNQLDALSRQALFGHPLHIHTGFLLEMAGESKEDDPPAAAAAAAAAASFTSVAPDASTQTLALFHSLYGDDFRTFYARVNYDMKNPAEAQNINDIARRLSSEARQLRDNLVQNSKNHDLAFQESALNYLNEWLDSMLKRIENMRAQTLSLAASSSGPVAERPTTKTTRLATEFIAMAAAVLQGADDSGLLASFYAFEASYDQAPIDSNAELMTQLFNHFYTLFNNITTFRTAVTNGAETLIEQIQDRVTSLEVTSNEVTFQQELDNLSCEFIGRLRIRLIFVLNVILKRNLDRYLFLMAPHLGAPSSTLTWTPTFARPTSCLKSGLSGANRPRSVHWREIDDIKVITPRSSVASSPTGISTPRAPPPAPLPPPAPVMPDENVVGHPYKKGPIRAVGNAREVDYIVVERMPIAPKVLAELKKVKQGTDLYIEAIDLMDAEAAVAYVPAGRGGHIFFTIPNADTAKDARRLILWRRAVAISQKFRLPSVVDDGDVRSAPQLGGGGQVWSYNRTSRYPSLIDTVSSALYDV